MNHETTSSIIARLRKQTAAIQKKHKAKQRSDIDKAANKKRSAATKGQHQVSKPRAGETMVVVHNEQQPNEDRAKGRKARATEANVSTGMVGVDIDNAANKKRSAAASGNDNAAKGRKEKTVGVHNEHALKQTERPGRKARATEANVSTGTKKG